LLNSSAQYIESPGIARAQALNHLGNPQGPLGTPETSLAFSMGINFQNPVTRGYTHPFPYQTADGAGQGSTDHSRADRQYRITGGHAVTNPAPRGYDASMRSIDVALPSCPGKDAGLA